MKSPHVAAALPWNQLSWNQMLLAMLVVAVILFGVIVGVVMLVSNPRRPEGLAAEAGSDGDGSDSDDQKGADDDTGKTTSTPAEADSRQT